MTPKKCLKCGFEITDEANYCSNCGLALKDPMPEIQYFNEKISTANKKIADVAEQSLVESEAHIKNEDAEVKMSSAYIEDSSSEDIALNNEMPNEGDRAVNQSCEDEEQKEDVRILGLSEGVFYTSLLVIGIVAIVIFKWCNDPQWLRGASQNSQLIEAETTKTDSVLQDTSTMKITIDPIHQETTDSSPIDKTNETIVSFKIPKQSGAPTDTAYHVIITSLKDSAMAHEVASKGKYSGAYVISDDKLHKVAVFRSLKREDAQLYVDSVIKKDCPDAWIFHGTAK